MQVVNRLARGFARPIAWALCLGFIARAYSRSLLSGLISQGYRLRKLWETTISELLPPKNPCGSMTPLALTGVYQGFPKSINQIHWPGVLAESISQGCGPWLLAGVY